MHNRKQEPVIYKASYLLRSKVGCGPLDPEALRQCREVVNKNDFDFVPRAYELLGQFDDIIALTRQSSIDPITARREMVDITMQIKANGSMFGHPVATQLATIMLFFLETVERIDNDALEIAAVFTRAAGLVVSLGTDKARTRGHALEHELKRACGRYFARLQENRNEQDSVYFVEF
jgi:hypothetical protein